MERGNKNYEQLTKEKFKRVEDCSALDLKMQSDKEDLTFRVPEETFNGQSMSAYFKVRSEPLATSEKITCITKKDIADMNSQLTLLQEISATDSVIAVTRKLLMQKSKKNKGTKNVCKSSSPFLPTANSTELSSLVLHKDTKPFVIPKVTSLRLPLFVLFPINAIRVQNNTSVSYTLFCQPKTLDKNFKFRVTRSAFVPPHFEGVVDTGFQIMPLKTGVFHEELEIYLESRDVKVKVSCNMLACTIAAENVKLSCVGSSLNEKELHFFQFDEASHLFEFEINNDRFDVDVPLEFCLSDGDNTEFMLYATASEIFAGLENYRCPKPRTLKVSANSDTLIRVPVSIKSSVHMVKEKLTVYLDSHHRDILQIYTITAVFWEKKILSCRCLQASDKTITLSKGKTKTILLKNKSDFEAIVVTIGTRNAKSVLAFNQPNVFLPPKSHTAFDVTLLDVVESVVYIHLIYHAGLTKVTDTVHITVFCTNVPDGSRFLERKS